jgi:hypothetical protein
VAPPITDKALPVGRRCCAPPLGVASSSGSKTVFAEREASGRRRTGKKPTLPQHHHSSKSRGEENPDRRNHVWRRIAWRDPSSPSSVKLSMHSRGLGSTRPVDASPPLLPMRARKGERKSWGLSCTAAPTSGNGVPVTYGVRVSALNTPKRQQPQVPMDKIGKSPLRASASSRSGRRNSCSC